MKPCIGIARALLVVSLVAIASPALAQQGYPAKPITLLIPFPPGTGNDVVGRIVGNKLSDLLGQRVVADNRAGAWRAAAAAPGRFSMAGRVRV